MLETNYGCKMSNGAGRKADAPLEVLNIIQHARCQIYTTYIYTHTHTVALFYTLGVECHSTPNLI
jgi:hypothetical protein